MLRTLCKAKITNAVISDKMMHYAGSIGLDRSIMDAADILPGEQVHVLNLNNGERFVTYVIEEKQDSGKVVLYGPAVRRGETGDQLVILSYCLLETKECHNFKQRYVPLSRNNKCK